MKIILDKHISIDYISFHVLNIATLDHMTGYHPLFYLNCERLNKYEIIPTKAIK